MVGKSPWENGGSVHLGTCVSLGYKIARIEEPCLSRAASKAVTWHNPGYSRVQCLTWNAILSLKHIKIYETALQMSTNIYKNTQKTPAETDVPKLQQTCRSIPPVLGRGAGKSHGHGKEAHQVGHQLLHGGLQLGPHPQWYPHDTEVS